MAFGMTRQTFDQPSFAAAIRLLANELLASDRDRRARLAARFANEDLLDAVLREARRAAWFTFPLPLGNADLERRCAELSLDGDDLAAMQTLIVLPLNAESRAGEGMATVLEEISGKLEPSTGPTPAAAFLFLAGIGSVATHDRVRGHSSLVTKRETAPRQSLSNHTELIQLETRSGGSGISPSGDCLIQRWRVIESRIGDRDPAQRAALQSAIRSLRLPEQNWGDVEQIPVAVALPEAAGNGKSGDILLGQRGVFASAFRPAWQRAFRFRCTLISTEKSIARGSILRMTITASFLAKRFDCWPNWLNI